MLLPTLVFITEVIYCHIYFRMGDPNPWAIASIEEFLFYCCPECEVRDQSEDTFIHHALEAHPNSRDFLLPIKVKLECKDSFVVTNGAEDGEYYEYDWTNKDLDEDNAIKDELEDSQIHGDEFKLTGGIIKKEYDDAEIEALKESDSHYSNLVSEQFEPVSGNDTSERNSKQKKKVIKRRKKQPGEEKRKLGPRKTEVKCFEQDCDFTINKRWKLLRHLEEVHQSLSGGTCLKCNKTVSKSNVTQNNVQYMYLHMQSCYNPETVSCCDKCGKQFISPYSLNVHLKNVHSLETYECEKCGKIFKSLDGLEQHKVTHDENRKRFHCQLCTNDYTTPQALEKHILKFHEGKDFRHFQCDLCGSKFESKSKLAHHHDIRHNKDYKGVECDLCKKTLKTVQSLELHKKLVHDKERNHFCHVCAKSFQTPFYLKHHILAVHKGVKKFKCKLCEKTFAHDFGLKRHVSSFHEGKRYNCNQCGRSFTQEYHLKTHVDTSH